MSESVLGLKHQLFCQRFYVWQEKVLRGHLQHVLFNLHRGTMVNFVALAREHWVNILVPMGFVIGWYLDRQQDQKLTAFRNKSALYSR